MKNNLAPKRKIPFLSMVLFFAMAILYYGAYTYFASFLKGAGIFEQIFLGPLAIVGMIVASLMLFILVWLIIGSFMGSVKQDDDRV